MATRTARRPASRGPLSKERVLEAAIAIADEGGVDALTMRRLGRRLGVEAMSVYHYAANKRALLDEMLDIVVAEFVPASPDGPWKSELRRSAIAAHRALLRHSWAAPLLESSEWGPARLRYIEAELAALARAGLTPSQTDYAYHALESHIVGFTLWQTNLPLKGKSRAQIAAAADKFLKQIADGPYPHVVQHVKQHLAPAAGSKSAFEFGLDLLLDGLERLL